MGEIDLELRRIRRQIARQDRRIASMRIKGRVTHVDDAARKLRLSIGTTAEGKPVLSPWVSWSEPRTGAFSADHAPVKVGDPMVLDSPSGVIGTSSIARRDGFSGDNPAPSTAGDAAVEKTGSLTITKRADGLSLEVGGTSWSFTAEGLKQTGGKLEHDGHAIDKSHTHTDVDPGGGMSGPPA